jgi:methylmalonyl-CoA mutase
MEESSFEELLQKNFPGTNRKDWESVAISELNGSEHLKELTFNLDDDLKFSSYQDRNAVEHLSYLKRYCVAPSEREFNGPLSWSNLPLVTISDFGSSNQKALEHLQNGADGVQFVLSENTQSVSALLKDIKPEYCLLSFKGFLNQNFITSVFSEFNTSATSSTISGHFFWDKIPQLRNVEEFLRYPDFKFLGFEIKYSTAVTEITDALICGLSVIKKFSTESSVEKIINAISFSLPLHNNFLADVAKLKALRILWYQVVRAYNVKDYSLTDLHIHVRSERFSNENFEPHGNLLKSTLSAMAGVIGNCNSLTLYPQDPFSSMMGRVARNVSNILREESHLNKVSDPLAGAYIIDAMTDQMCRRAWELFQSKQS